MTPLRSRRLGLERLEERTVLTGYVPLAPKAAMAWTTGFFTPTGTANLQGWAPAAPDAATGAATYPTVQVNAAGLPLLQSRPNGAGLEIFAAGPPAGGR